MAIRLALAGDGELVNEHFGHARYFAIVDLEGDTYKKIEVRTVKSEYAGMGCGECGGGGESDIPMERKFAGTLDVISDCHAVFVTRIGQGAAYYLLNKGIRVFQVFGTVDEVLEHIIKNGLLKEGEE